MRVALDAIPLAEPKTGVGHYTSELGNALASLFPDDEFNFVSPSYVQESSESRAANLFHNKAPATKFWWSLGLPLFLRKSTPNVFHGTNYEVPLWSSCRTVLSIHDLSLLLYPQTHLQKLVRRARYRLPLMARVADRIVTGTDSIKTEIVEHLKISPRKIAVTPYAPRQSFRQVPSVEADEVKQTLGISDPFLLFVGTLEPRKNLVTVIRAFEEMLTHTDLRPELVIVGKEGWLMNETLTNLRDAPYSDLIRITGYISDYVLSALYSSCTACIYPSLYEGFGLPPLEAMACGAPVVASRIPSIVEVTGNAACLVPALDHVELARAMVDLVKDRVKRQHLSRKGLERSKDFTWERTARMTMEVYHELMQEKH